MRRVGSYYSWSVNGFDADGAEIAERRGDGVGADEREPLLHHDTTGAILGAFYAVQSELGSGFLEAVYANALTVLLRAARLQVDRQALFEVVFHGVTIGMYRADLIVESKIVVEIKAARAIDRK